MLRAESKRAVKRFGDELQNVLNMAVRDAEELKHAYNKGPLGKGEEAVKFSSTMQAEVQQVHSKVPPLVRLSIDTPRAGDMVDAAFAHLKAITDVFDCFENRLESAYDIPPVVLPERKMDTTEDASLAPAPEPVVAGVGSLSSLMPGSTAKPPRTPMSRTPRSTRKKDVDMPIPATPKLEDFGISNDDVCEELRGLGMSTATQSTQVESEWLMSRHEATPRNEPRVRSTALRKPPAAANAIEIDLDGDFEENVQKSMTAYGIETPVQVAEKFETMRHQALTKMMVTTTPRLKSGGVERTLDYTGLAGGYFKSSAGAEETPSIDTHRQLNFDETPRVGGGRNAAGDEMRQRIAESFDSLGFWRDKVSCETLQDAAVLLQREGNRSFDKRELSNILKESLPGLSCYSIIASLTKLQVLQMVKRQGEEATYRIV